MRSLSFLSAVGWATQSTWEGLILPDVLGNLTAPATMASWASGSQQLNLKGSRKDNAYYDKRSVETCDFPLQILILQDVTDSFSDNIMEMKTVQLNQMINGLKSSHPDSQFAMLSFQDKAIWPLGDRDDACVIFNSDFSEDTQPIYDAYDKAQSYGGADAPENHFGAVFAALQSQKLTWKQPSTEYTRLIVVVTDAGPHFDTDGANTMNLLPFQGHYQDDQYDDICLKQYYPSPDQVKNLIQSKEVYVASFVYDGDWANGWAARSWKTFNAFLGQTDAFVEPTAEDSSDFWPKLSAVLKEIEDIECQPATTTTPAPPTTTTPAPPTTTTPAPPTTTTTEEECTGDKCECVPEVIIKLKHMPKDLHVMADGQVVQ